MKSNAAGQLLGYALQFPRAFYHLLKSGPGDCVCVEVLGDVATVTAGGLIISEEDKSSIVGNPLTDRSTDLWKTFSNWINAVNNGDLSITNTRFILYCNKTGNPGIVDCFHAAQNNAEASAAIKFAKTTLLDITTEHEIWKYYDYSVDKNASILQAIVERFEFQTGNSAGTEALRHELKSQHVADTQIDFFIEKILGWLLKTIMEQIAAKKPAVIRWEEYDREFKVIFERTRCRELVDFTLVYPPDTSNIEQHVKTKPYFIRQLEAIEATEDDILEAVTDYLRSKINLSKWIEDEIIDSEIADDFESRLQKYWKNAKTRIEITHKSLSESERGQLLCADCKSRQEPIRDMSPPISTIEGTYHSLANKPVLGWHPKWSELLCSVKGE